MKTKFFTLLAFTMLCLVAASTESKAQGINLISEGKINVREYPNPATDYATIETTLPSPMSGTAIIGITNMSGQVMYSDQCSDCGGKTTRQVFVKNYPAGLYNVSVSYKGRIITTKFFVIK